MVDGAPQLHGLRRQDLFALPVETQNNFETATPEESPAYPEFWEKQSGSGGK